MAILAKTIDQLMNELQKMRQENANLREAIIRACVTGKYEDSVSILMDALGKDT